MNERNRPDFNFRFFTIFCCYLCKELIRLRRSESGNLKCTVQRQGVVLDCKWDLVNKCESKFYLLICLLSIGGFTRHETYRLITVPLSAETEPSRPKNSITKSVLSGLWFARLEKNGIIYNRTSIAPSA